MDCEIFVCSSKKNWFSFAWHNVWYMCSYRNQKTKNKTRTLFLFDNKLMFFNILNKSKWENINNQPKNKEIKSRVLI